MAMMLLSLVLALSVALSLPFLTATSLHSLDTAPVIHFTLARREGAMDATVQGEDHVNLGFLSSELQRTESRFNLTKRELSGNKLVRKAKVQTAGGRPEGMLMGEVASSGIWYANVQVGNPPQEIQMDLNMLVTDFYVLTTTSRAGSRFDELFSHSYAKSNKHPHPACSSPTDVFHLPTIRSSVELEFTHCRPSKASLKALGQSGSTLGLAPSEHLSQTRSKSILKQLLEKKIIERPVFSLMLVNGREGVLSLGGTAANAIDMVVSQTELELENLGALERAETSAAGTTAFTKRDGHEQDALLDGASWEKGWTWSRVQGAEGWWQVLMQGVWIDGVKVLQNQAVVVDVNSPFILAPPLAAKAFYSSVSGSWPLPAPHSNFYAYPCLNPPLVHFGFGGSKFPFMQGGRGAEWNGMPGGKFSLGRLRKGSGYCVGAVVETRMGVKEEAAGELLKESGRRGSRKSWSGGSYGTSGMRETWVIGEGFFRGIGGVFDFQDLRVGFRTY